MGRDRPRAAGGGRLGENQWGVISRESTADGVQADSSGEQLLCSVTQS